MTQLVGKNEGVQYVMGMAHQRPSEGMEYPSNTNMRGGARAAGGAEHHADGDMVGARPEPVAMRAKKGGMIYADC